MTYDELLGLLPEAACEPTASRKYKALDFVFTRLLYEATLREKIVFSGVFSKTDFLLKRHAATPRLQAAVNTARVRLRQAGNGRLPEAEAEACFAADSLAVGMFVKCVAGLPYDDSALPRRPADGTEAGGQPKAAAVAAMRIIVDSFDDATIFGRTDADAAGGCSVSYMLSPRKEPRDRSYLRKLLRKGSQLNLISPTTAGGTIYAEYIIFEPDYLVDATTVASCFEEYAESPVVRLLGKLKSVESSPAILLGNFAGQLLDECVHSRGRATSYAESVTAFCRKNALQMLASGIDASFHMKAQLQRDNIYRAMTEQLPQAVGKTAEEDMVLEASFFSEMFGLQGRMDLMDAKFRFVIEQKSGRCGWPPLDEHTPRLAVKHYVQLLLYMVVLRYNYHAAYKSNGGKLYEFILYSKYRNSLLDVSFAPGLIFRALKLRNRIVAAEAHYAEHGFSILTGLTPDKVNELHATSRLWTDHQGPQIYALLESVQGLSAVEKAWYLRFMRFLAKEHYLSKVGNFTPDDSGFASVWQCTTEEKLAAGNIYTGLRLVSPDADKRGPFDTVVFAIAPAGGSGQAGAAQPDADTTNFRCGDIVFFYPYSTTPDATRHIVMRATISKMTPEELTLTLRAEQSDARVLLRDAAKPWALEHDFMESSFTGLYPALHTFATSPQPVRDLFLLQRRPRVDTSLTLNGSYGDFDSLALRVKQARDLFLIIGPPGTGKTSFGMLNTLREELTDPDASVLLLSYTNRAIDEICSKLEESHIDYLRLGSRQNCAPAYRPHLLDERMALCSRLDEMEAELSRCRVVAGTAATLSSHAELFRLRQFSLAIVDEASQILEPHLAAIIGATDDCGQQAIGRYVFIGDHKQLPAVVCQSPADSAVSEPELRAIGLTDCRLSLFERLLRRYRDDESVVYTLTRQGRMHHDIADFPNLAYYGNRLTEVPLPHQLGALPETATPQPRTLETIAATCRMAFVDCPPPDNPVSDKVNQSEADAIARLSLSIWRHEGGAFDPDKTLGIIVPYRNQIATIRRALAGCGAARLADVSIDTVERYQGSQRDYIIYGFTAQKPYQLDFLTQSAFEEDGALIDRKLNVAMTRARLHLYLFGSLPLLSLHPAYSRLLSYVRSHDLVVRP